MPMVMSPVGARDGSGRRPYGSAAATTNSTTDDGTSKRTLRK